jgi:hypothetical protein
VKTQLHYERKKEKKNNNNDNDNNKAVPGQAQRSAAG